MHECIVFHICRCSECFQPLKESYFTKENELFCKEHFTMRFSQVCQKCNTRITGPVMVNLLPKFIFQGHVLMKYYLESNLVVFMAA